MRASGYLTNEKMTYVLHSQWRPYHEDSIFMYIYTFSSECCELSLSVTLASIRPNQARTHARVSKSV